MKDDQDNRSGLYISIIMRAAQGYFYHKLKGWNIGPGQQAYLLALLPGETIVQDELARRLKVDKANVTRAVKRLEKSGYITRSRCQEDKRAWRISLTPEGFITRKKIEGISQEWVNILKKPLSDDNWRHLVESLASIAQSLENEKDFV